MNEARHSNLIAVRSALYDAGRKCRRILWIVVSRLMYRACVIWRLSIGCLIDMRCDNFSAQNLIPVEVKKYLTSKEQSKINRLLPQTPIETESCDTTSTKLTKYYALDESRATTLERIPRLCKSRTVVATRFDNSHWAQQRSLHWLTRISWIARYCR